MSLSDYGKIVVTEWDKSFEIRKELFCDSFVIMPNHLHAILRIEHSKNDVESVETQGLQKVNNNDVFLFDDVDQQRYMEIIRNAHKTNAIGVRLDNGVRVHEKCGVAYRPPKSISSFVAGFKSSVSTIINDNSATKRPSIWQTRFHDHIIRDHHEHRFIENYIDTNVENWGEEQFYID